MQQLLRDVQHISSQHYQRWSGNGLDKNDLESEAVDWAWPRFEKLQTMHSQNAIGYMNYMKTAIKRLLDRHCQEEMVRMVGASADHENSDYNGYTYVTAKTALKKKDVTVFNLAATCCTAKQMAALEGVYLEGLSGDEVAALLGVTRQTVHSAIDRAIHNIVSRSAAW
jgi:DNA-directed RNA polymerase specialized sigma24 family protein